MHENPVIMIRLAGRSPRLVRRWRELGLLPGFSMLAQQPSPQMANGRSLDGLVGATSHSLQLTELWANDLVSESFLPQVAGTNSRLTDLGTEQLVSALPEHPSAGQFAGVMLSAGVSLLTIGRALASRYADVFNDRAHPDQSGLTWLRWEIFKARWLLDRPAAALLSLPGPELYGRRVMSDPQTASRAEPFAACSDQQVEYAQAVMASYVLVDTVMKQAVKVAQRRRAGLIVLIESFADQPDEKKTGT